MLEFLQTDIGKVSAGALIALAGQILVFLLGWIKESNTLSRSKRSDAEYLSMHLVISLEKLISDCYTAINDPLIEDERGSLQNTISNPKFTLPHEGDYKNLPTQTMYRILSIPNRLESFEEGLDWVSEYDDPPDYPMYYNYRKKHLSRLGLFAISQLETLCEEYRIPEPERAEHYEPKEAFLKELARHR